MYIWPFLAHAGIVSESSLLKTSSSLIKTNNSSLFCSYLTAREREVGGSELQLAVALYLLCYTHFKKKGVAIKSEGFNQISPSFTSRPHTHTLHHHKESYRCSPLNNHIIKPAASRRPAGAARHPQRPFLRSFRFSSKKKKKKKNRKRSHFIFQHGGRLHAQSRLQPFNKSRRFWVSGLCQVF